MTKCSSSCVVFGRLRPKTVAIIFKAIIPLSTKDELHLVTEFEVRNFRYCGADELEPIPLLKFKRDDFFMSDNSGILVFDVYLHDRLAAHIQYCGTDNENSDNCGPKPYCDEPPVKRRRVGEKP